MRNRRKRSSILVLLLMMLIGVTVGYAALSTDLTITGTSKIKSSSWDIHFENVQVKSGSVTASVAPVANSSDKKTELTYTIELVKPGDFYEFDVDVVNGGSVDAKLSALPTISGVSAEQEAYTNYTFTHKSGTDIAVGETIAAGGKTTFTVRVEYDKNVQASDLPTSDQNMTLTVAMNYEQN